MLSQRDPKFLEVGKIFELEFYCEGVYAGFLYITNVLRNMLANTELNSSSYPQKHLL